MSFEEKFKREVECIISSYKDRQISVSNLLSFLQDVSNLTPSCFECLGDLLKEVLGHYRVLNLNVQIGIDVYKLETSNKETDDYNKLEWIKALYDEITKILGAICKQKVKKELKSGALETLLNLLPSHAKCLMEKVSLFPVEQLEIILENIIFSESGTNILVTTLKGFLTYKDVETNMWKALENIVMKTKLTEKEVNIILIIIGQFPKPNAPEQINEKKYFCGFTGAVLNKKLIAKSVIKIWEKLLIIEISEKNIEHLLTFTLIEHMMPRMNKPIFLTDYFMSCLDSGGAMSMLGLQGIFILIQEHNINYPDIYTKLYSLFSPEIFSTSYKARLYYLSDIFLSSTHLPENLVAGFVKKLARLSLFAPPPDIIIIMAFITNLIIRHPSLKKLMHNTQAIDVNLDPFNDEEPDPSRSRGMDSSLWEVKLLQEHAIPAVAASAMFILNPLSSVEHKLSDLLEVETSDVFMREYKKKVKHPPLCFEKPSSLILPNAQTGFTLWSLTN